MKKKLGKLERVELRKAWAKEDTHFTPWLAREENLKLLEDALKMNLELEAQEESVGRFRADILCKNPDDDSWVLIENQLASTDHRHLGQVLTYAAGRKAATIVWVASEFTDEHRAALDWLNEITDEKFHFFGLEIELWQIGSSPLAPKFNVVVQPNNWSKLIAQTTKRSRGQEALEHDRYWQQFLNYRQEKGSKLRLSNPKGNNYIAYSTGISTKNCHIAVTRDTRKNHIGVELYMWGPNKENFFHQLKEDKIAIEGEIGSDLDWILPMKITQIKSADLADENNWLEQYEWLEDRIKTFVKVLVPRVSKLEPEQWNPDGEVA